MGCFSHFISFHFYYYTSLIIVLPGFAQKLVMKDHYQLLRFFFNFLITDKRSRDKQIALSEEKGTLSYLYCECVDR